MTGKEAPPEFVPRVGEMHATIEADWEDVDALVRSGDQDRYWAGLFLSSQPRGYVFALYAFNIELSRIGEQVREPFLGEIRLQWWRDALAAPAVTEIGNPVADCLIATRFAYDLPMDLLGGMIDARSRDIHRDPVETMDELRAYLIATAGALFRLGACITGARGNGPTDAACEAAAMAYGLTGLMRSLPHHAARGRLYLPGGFLRAFGVEGDALLRGEESEGLKAALGILRAQASEALAAFRQSAAALPESALPIFLPLTLVPAYLHALGQPSHRPLKDIVQLNPLGRYARIGWGNLRGRV